MVQNTAQKHRFAFAGIAFDPEKSILRTVSEPNKVIVLEDPRGKAFQ
jgi:hypothetical protein